MKKLIAVFLAILMALPFAFASAEEQAQTEAAVEELLQAITEEQAPQDFFQAFGAWFAGLKNEQYDYKANLLTDGQSVGEAVLRTGGGIIELEVPNLGRLQFSESGVAGEVGGQGFVINPEFLNKKEQKEENKVDLPDKEEVQADLNMLQPWLDRALKEILMPCAHIGLSFSGVTVHVEATDEILREKTWAFIDKLMAERKTLETLLAHYGPLLEKVIPDMPKTFDELKALWDKEKANPAVTWPDFRLIADATYSVGFTGKTISLDATIDWTGLGQAKITAEVIPARDGLDVIASLDTIGAKGRTGAYSLDLHVHSDKVNVALGVPGNVYRLNAERTLQADYISLYTAVLEEQKNRNQLLLDAVYDSRDSSLKAELYRNTAGSEEPSVKLAAMDLFIRENGWDWALTLESSRYALHHTGGDQYHHLKAEINNSFASDLYFDLWIYQLLDGTRIKLDSNFLNANNPHIYTLTTGAEGIEFTCESDYGRKLECRVKYSRVVTETGFEINVEYMNCVAQGDTFNTGDRPSTLKIVRDGADFRADLDWSSAGSQAFAVSLAPHKVTYTDRSGVYETAVTENTPEKLAVRMTKDGTEELGSIVLTLAGDLLRGVLSTKDGEIGSFTVERVEKQPIRKITIQ
jgi:hypothetical protein